MDSWTDKQLGHMKMGGNDKLNNYLKAQGIDARTPIKQKYESDAAQLYKEQLKARVEGRPEPKDLSHVQTRKPAVAGDANGMERLAGETDQQYIARQTRLREEARARMANKFGGSSGKMQGIGSDPSYNPNAGGGGGGDPMVDSLVSGFGSALSTMGSMAGSILKEDNVQSLKSTGASFWGSLTSGVSNVASTLTQPDGNDGLADLQREFSSHKPQQSKYAGFGSEQRQPSFGAAPSPARTPAPSSGGVQEAPGLPGEDRNGIARLTGESDDQYVARQTRLRDEARARMAAKFGNNASMSSASSGPPQSAPVSGNRPAPSSGNSFSSTPSKTISSDDFFSSFGT